MPDSTPSIIRSSSRSRGSIALFLAAASLATGAPGISGTSAQANEFPSLATPELLAQATQACIPIGEGENCAKPRRRTSRSVLPPEGEATTKPADPAAETEQNPAAPTTPAN